MNFYLIIFFNTVIYKSHNDIFIFSLSIMEKAKQKPVTTNMLRHLVKSKLPYVDRNLGSIVSIIRHSMQNAAAFETTAELLKEVRVETVRLA